MNCTKEVVSLHPVSDRTFNLAMLCCFQNPSSRRENRVRRSQLLVSMVHKLPMNILLEIFQYVGQFDLVLLLLTCFKLYEAATERLYKRVTVILNAEFPVRYARDSCTFIKENGIAYMDSSLIVGVNNLVRFMQTLHVNPPLIQKVKFFVFDKCYPDNLLKENYDLNLIQSDIIEFFGRNSWEINFLHITFVDFMSGIEKLTKFLRNRNIRNKIFKLFVTRLEDLCVPVIPQGLTNLFLMIDEHELMHMNEFDLGSYPYSIFNSLYTLTCSTNKQLGLEILRKFKLRLPSEDSKLKLKGFTAFHCHKEFISSDESESLSSFDLGDSKELQDYIGGLDKRLDFKVISDKIDLTYLTHLYLKIDCNVHRNNNCSCFPDFFKNLASYSRLRGGLPNLISFELELFPNFEWLRPHQILETILTPLGSFIKTLRSLVRLTIDLSTLGFKMFDNIMGMSSVVLNKLNERLIEAFFLCFFTSSQRRTTTNLKTLQFPDFLTSFIYYKPDFYESLLHTCQCWGCHLVLRKLNELFMPLSGEDEIRDMDDEATYYILIGFILGKLQTDREVCIPIKQRTFNYRNYPIYKGQPHTLHNHFHQGCTKCGCNINDDPNAESSTSIDNLVTTYIVHQLRPLVKYLTTIFCNLDNLMIHGIYYEYDKASHTMKPIFDDDEYPQSFLIEKEEEIRLGIKPDIKFGYFGGNDF